MFYISKYIKIIITRYLQFPVHARLQTSAGTKARLAFQNLKLEINLPADTEAAKQTMANRMDFIFELVNTDSNLLVD